MFTRCIWDLLMSQECFNNTDIKLAWSHWAELCLHV